MKKFLGQHFLINKAATKKIVAALDLQPKDTIIEIGPGAGALTIPLLKGCQASGIRCQVIAIEKDPQLAKKLSENIQLPISNFQIITGDALKELPKLAVRFSLTANRFKVVGNIPYYITGKLLRILSELKNKPELIVLMIQKEVAERITAEPPQMNLLAAAVQFWAEPKILFTLKPKDFNPPPKVDSAVIKLTPKPQRNRETEKLRNRDYYKTIKIIFKQPRKTILNNLKDGLKLSTPEIEKILKTLKIDPKSRPQNLSLEKIGEIVYSIHL